MGKSGGQLLKLGAFAALGGLTGGLFTAGAFSMVGASAGVMLGGMLFAQPQAPGVSSVGDIKAQKSDAGFLPITCGGPIDDPRSPGEKLDGGVLLPALVIKVAPEGGISRVKIKKKKSGGGTGGKLFGAQQSGGEAHYASCAVAWCEGSTEHPQKLYELKADDKILFREDAEENEDGYVERTFIHDSQDREIGWQSENFRHYYGTGTQGRDDVLEQWYQREGLHAPAHQGTAYTMILNHQIDEFGHFPSYFGRLGNGLVERREQCRFYLLRSNGLDGETTLPPETLQLTGDWGQQRGWFMTQPRATREIGELIASRAKRALVEHSWIITSVDLANPTIWTLEDWELAASGDGEGERVPRFKRGVESDIALASRVEVRYADFRRRDENTVPAILPTAAKENVMTFEMPCVDTEEEIHAWAQMTLDASHVSGKSGEVSTLPRRIQVTPGDVLRVPKKGHSGQYSLLMVKTRLVAAPGPINFQGNSWAASAYTDSPHIVPTIRPVDAIAWAKPLLFVANTICLGERMLSRAGVIIAPCQTPDFKWEKGVRVHIDKRTGPGDDDWDEIDEFIVSSKATLGRTGVAWLPTHPSRGYVSDTPLVVEMFEGALVTATQQQVRGGANRILFENGIVVAFTVALQTGLTPQGLGIYELSGIKAGVWGSDVLFSGAIPAGTRFALIVDENGEGADEDIVNFETFEARDIGKTFRLRASMIEKSKAETLREFTLTGANLKPLSPSDVHVTLDASGLTLSGRARVRGAGVGGWDVAKVQMTEPRGGQGYKFWVEITSGGVTKRIERFTPDDQGVFSWTWGAAELTSMFGVNPGSLLGTVAMDGQFGVGFSRAWGTI